MRTRGRLCGCSSPRSTYLVIIGSHERLLRKDVTDPSSVYLQDQIAANRGSCGCEPG